MTAIMTISKDTHDNKDYLIIIEFIYIEFFWTWSQ